MQKFLFTCVCSILIIIIHIQSWYILVHGCNLWYIVHEFSGFIFHCSVMVTNLQGEAISLANRSQSSKGQIHLHLHVQWNPSIPDTLGTAQSVLIKGGVLTSGVSL